MDVEVIRILDDTTKTPEEKALLIEEYTRTRLAQKINELMSQLPPPRISIETGGSNV